ncbi:hypothetical protein ACFLUG_05000 [Chloroflexota bacterium]
MPETYKVGEEILIKQIGEQSTSVREAALSPYSGQTGTITNYYWITPPTGEVFYLYTVQVGASSKELTLYEDEITSLTTAGPKYRQAKGK